MVDEKVRFDGETVKIGGKDYVLPGLSVGQARKLWPQLLEFQAKSQAGAKLDEQLNTFIEVVHQALTRNYPELKIDQLEDELTPGELAGLVTMISRQSGLKQVPKGEAPAEAATA